MNNILVLIDAPAFLHRAWHAIPHFTDEKGRETGALYGFITALFKIIKTHQPRFICAAYDFPAPTQRHIVYKEYKATRVKKPQEFYDQFAFSKQFLDTVGIPYFEKEGFEADDLIATIIRRSKNVEKYIFSGDHDLFQLLQDQSASVYLLQRSMTDTYRYSRDEFIKKYNFEPKFFRDYKALRGDPSDNIKGVEGIGEKTAQEIIACYHTLENMYEHIDELSARAAIKEKIKQQEKEIYFMRELVTLRDDIEIDFTIEKCEPAFSRQQTEEFFKNVGFKSLIDKIPVHENRLF